MKFVSPTLYRISEYYKKLKFECSRLQYTKLYVLPNMFILHIYAKTVENNQETPNYIPQSNEEKETWLV